MTGAAEAPGSAAEWSVNTAVKQGVNDDVK